MHVVPQHSTVNCIARLHDSWMWSQGQQITLTRDLGKKTNCDFSDQDCDFILHVQLQFNTHYVRDLKHVMEH